MKPPSDPQRIAQPADEEIKKHGDPMKQQVKEAAGKTQEEGAGQPQPGGDDAPGSTG